MKRLFTYKVIVNERFPASEAISFLYKETATAQTTRLAVTPERLR